MTRFRELNDLVLQLKGLVLVRELHLASLTAAAPGRRSRPPRRLAPLSTLRPGVRVGNTVHPAYGHSATRQETEERRSRPRLQAERGAEPGELRMYDAEIERVRDRLVSVVKEGGGVERVAA